MYDMIVVQIPPTIESVFLPTSNAARRHTCMLPRISHKIQQHQTTKTNEAPKNNPISPLLRPNPPNQTIDSWHLTRRSYYPPVDTRNRLPLHPKLLVNRICLAQHAIYDTIAVVDSAPFVEHIICFCVCGIGVAVG